MDTLTQTRRDSLPIEVRPVLISSYLSYSIVFSHETCKRNSPSSRTSLECRTYFSMEIVSLTQQYQPGLAIPPLQNLLNRYPPDSSYLTTIHPIFLLVRQPIHSIVAFSHPLLGLCIYWQLQFCASRSAKPNHGRRHN